MTKGILWAVLTEPIVIQPLYPNGLPHHVTLFFDVLKEDWQQWLDIEFEAHAIANCYNNNVQAILLDMPLHIPHKAHPHITVSYRDGIAPSAANQMLASGDYQFEPLKMAFRLRIEFFEFTRRHCQFCGVELSAQAKKDTIYCNRHRYKVNRTLDQITEDIGTRYELADIAPQVLKSRLNILQELDIKRLGELVKKEKENDYS